MLQTFEEIFVSSVYPCLSVFICGSIALAFIGVYLRLIFEFLSYYNPSLICTFSGLRSMPDAFACSSSNCEKSWS